MRRMVIVVKLYSSKLAAFLQKANNSVMLLKNCQNSHGCKVRKCVSMGYLNILKERRLCLITRKNEMFMRQ